MFVEAMVTAICLQNYQNGQGEGCPTALQAYYYSHTEISESLKRGEHVVRQYPYANEAIAYVFLPTYTALAAQRVKIEITKEVSVNYLRRDQALVLVYTIPL